MKLTNNRVRLAYEFIVIEWRKLSFDLMISDNLFIILIILQLYKYLHSLYI